MEQRRVGKLDGRGLAVAAQQEMAGAGGPGSEHVLPDKHMDTMVQTMSAMSATLTQCAQAMQAMCTSQLQTQQMF